MKYSKILQNVDFKVQNEEYWKLIETTKTDLKKNNIVVLNLYDENQKLLLSINDIAPFNQINSILELDNIALDQEGYMIIPVEENLVYLSFHKKQLINNKIYYSNILKELDTQTVNLVQKDIFTTITIVFFSVSFVFLAIFPIIFSQYNELLAKKNELLKSNIISIVSLGNAIAKRDSDTNEHNYRVTYYSIKIAEELNLSKEQIQSLIKGAFLHDVGKIAISDNILLKPGKLTKEEFEIMKTHVIHGIEIVKDDIWLRDATKVIQNHHERIDGSGYPNGLKGGDIPIEARVFMVADVFDALTSKRPYKEPFDLEESFFIIQNETNKHFDKEVVSAFKKIYKILYYNTKKATEKELKKFLVRMLIIILM
ncbi:HD-GYP domain-containing protein [Halarcobacter anaerophilus]|uniref:HD-GYP domain-containing protein n=1 Tax=Halarcobacter anaerophilus TaxID=877500 RepID=UPI0009FEEC9B|nr:HD-GYP domain-containing protein [Halarcobacter anaerophilus]